MNVRDQGVSLLELVVALGLAVVALGLVFFGFQGGKNRVGPKSAALFLKAELLSARERAIATEQPTAIAIPRGGADYAAGFYVRGGRTKADVLAVRNLEEEYRGVALFVGSVGSSVGAVEHSADESKYRQTADWALPEEGLATLGWDQVFDFESWIAEVPSTRRDDAYFVFLPNGSLTTNGLPSINGEYFIVVAAGVEAGGGALGRSGEAYTLSLSPEGGVHLSKGVAGSEGGSLPADSPVPLTGLVPNQATTPDPVCVGSAYPMPDPFEEIAGADSGVAVGQFLSMEIEVTDRTGLPLVASFSQELERAADPFWGYFGAQPPGSDGAVLEPQARTYDTMIWDQTRGVWRAFWTWTPHFKSQAGDTYNIMAEVGGRSKDFQVVIPEIAHAVVDSENRFVFHSDQGSPAGLLLYVMNESGAQEKILVNLPAGNISHPSVSWDGRRIAFRMNDGGGGNDDIWMTDPTGQELARLTNDPRAETAPSLSPLGDKIAWKIALGTDPLPPGDQVYALVWAPIDETDSPRFMTIQRGRILFDSFSWSADGERVAMEVVRENGLYEIWEFDTTRPLRGYFDDPDGTGASQAAHEANAWVNHPSMLQVPIRIDRTGGDGLLDGIDDIPVQQWRTDFNYHNPRLLVSSAQSVRCPSYNRDGTKLYYVAGTGNAMSDLGEVRVVQLDGFGNPVGPGALVFTSGGGGVTNPTESPDGRQLLYWEGNQIKIRDLLSGAPRALTSAGAQCARPDWITPPVPLGGP